MDIKVNDIIVTKKDYAEKYTKKLGLENIKIRKLFQYFNHIRLLEQKNLLMT